MVRNKEDYLVTLDVGSSFVRTVVVQLIPEGEPRVVGVGQVPSKGIRRGVIVDLEEVTEQIKKSIDETQQNSGVEIASVYVSVGGTQLRCDEAKGVVAVGRADGEVVEEDTERVIGAAQAINLPPNFEILHIVPSNFTLDDQAGIKDPIGMTGVRLELQGMIVYAASPHLRHLEKCLEQVGVGIEGFVSAPLAAAKAVLNKRQKELGVVNIDIGGGTTSLVVYEEQELVHLAVLPIGAGHITNDIAIGLRTSIDTAEKVKLRYGSALPKEINKRDEINLANLDENEEGSVSRKHVAEIIEARIEEIFYLAEKELKKIGKDVLLPAGIVLSGGGACLHGSVDKAKEILKLPVQTGFPSGFSGLVDKIDSPSFAVPVGIIKWILEDAEVAVYKGEASGSSSGKMPNIKQSVNTAKKWLEKFLP